MLNTEYCAFLIKPFAELDKILPGVTACVADLREWSTTDLMDGMSRRGQELRRIQTNEKYKDGNSTSVTPVGLLFPHYCWYWAKKLGAC